MSLMLIVAIFIGGKIFDPMAVDKLTGTLKFFNNNFSYFSKVFADYSHPLIAGIFLVLGVYYLCTAGKRQKEATWLAASFLVPLLLAVFLWRRNAGPQYIFFAQSFEMILIASGIYYMMKFFKDSLPQYKKYACCAPLVLSLLILPNYGYFFEENNAYHQNSQAENPDYRSIFGYFKKQRSKNDVLITRDFRNYYLDGAKVQIYDFGGELSTEHFSLEELQEIMQKHPSGWVIYSDNDESYIAKKARAYIEENMQKINAIPVRGKVGVYRWGQWD